MSAFKRHGIERLSPSSLNVWRETPGLWVLRYLFKVRDESSAAMWRGNAVEKGMEMILRGKPLDEATAAAMTEFEQQAQGEVSDEIDAERKRIPGMVGKVCDWHADMLQAKAAPELAATQLKVETYLDGVSIPVIGYVDFTFMEGADVDCKSTKACPSAPRPDHVRQIALYWRARNRPAALLYVTDKRFAYFAPSEADLHNAVAELTGAARSLERFLSRVSDPVEAAEMLPHPTDHFAYGQASKTKLMELAETF